jgi:hypothetical protein
MASLLSTTVPDNGYYRVGTSTNKAYVSAGGPYAHFGNDAWYSSALGWQGTGPFLQLFNNSLYFYSSASAFLNPLFVSAATTTISSTTTTINGALGVGAAAGTGQILVNAGGTSTPSLEVTNCLGDGRVVSTYPTFSGYLGIKIGASVGPATSVAAGTYYIRLWDK